MIPCIHRSPSPLGTVSICRRNRRRVKLREQFAVHGCAVFGRCLPILRRWQEQHQGAEAEIYHLCRGCDRREASPAE